MKLSRILLLIPALVAGALAYLAGTEPVSSALVMVAAWLACQLLIGPSSTVDQSGTRLLTMPEGMLLVKREHVHSDLASLAASLELQRSVFEASAELVSCVEEVDARDRFLDTMATYWRSTSADLFLWEKGRWRCIGAPPTGDEPMLTAAVRLPHDGETDLMLDLSPGVDGQAALVLRGASPQPTIAERTRGDQRYIAEVLRGVFALSLRRVMLYQRMEKLGRIDPLTTLFRRWYGERRLQELVEADHVVSVAMIDIDHFKRINDNYGHAAGDAVLRSLGQHIRHDLRTGDICCRFGGEEFLLILPQTSGPTAMRVAERLRSSIASIADLPCTVTVSIGVASCHIDETVSSLVKRADDALYSAKDGGRDRIIQAPEDDDGPIRTMTRRFIRSEQQAKDIDPQ